MRLGVLPTLPYIEGMDQKLDRRSLITWAACAALMPSYLMAQTAGEIAPAPTATAPLDIAATAPPPELPPEPPAFGPIDGQGLALGDVKFTYRPIVVFADTPRDPNFLRQMEILTPLFPQFSARDVIIITDTDPNGRSEIRQLLRPRGFSLVIMDKDWRSPIRRPSPRTAREVLNIIDRMPIARTEALERNPAGR